MSMPAVNKQVDRLEEALHAFIVNTDRQIGLLAQAQRQTQIEMRAFKDEMRAFKDEMGEFKDEMREFKDEMSAFKDEMSAFKDEMSVFKDEMTVFKDEMSVFKDEMGDFKNEMSLYKDRTYALEANMERSQQELRKTMGELSRKLGTMVEDMVAPSLPRVIQETLGGEVISYAQRVGRQLPGDRSIEYDMVAVTADLVCVNSTKATLRSEDVRELVTAIGKFREFFPEFRDYPVVGILASMSVDRSILRYAERQGFLVLAIGWHLMRVENTPGFAPKRW